MKTTIDLCQVEYSRVESGVSGYKPDPKIYTYTDLTAAVSQPIDPGISSHANQVAALLLGPTKGMIGTHYVCEAVSFMGRGMLNGGRTLAPAPSQWDIINMSFGCSCIQQDDINLKLAQQAERDNVIVGIGPADAGMDDYICPCAAVSPNIVRWTSSTTGFVADARTTPDLYWPIDWTSFAIPAGLAATAIPALAWLKGKGIAYKASDIVQIIKASANTVGLRRMGNGQASLGAIQNFYAPPVVVVVTPPVLISPAPPVNVVPTPDQEKADIAKTCGVTYDPAAKTFSGATSAQVKQLAQALQAAGL